tara:strand:+ start:166 stop:402 length:237 start_codon:yes stop_codon:yes gene_type:complete
MSVKYKTTTTLVETSSAISLKFSLRPGLMDGHNALLKFFEKEVDPFGSVSHTFGKDLQNYPPHARLAGKRAIQRNFFR